MREIDDIHVPFKAWLDAGQIPYIYHRHDRKSGIQTGHPDFTILWMRRQIMIECKGQGRPSPKQLERIAFLRRMGNVVEIARSFDECVEAAYKVLCEGKPSLGDSVTCNWPLSKCFKELKRAVAEVPGNGTEDLNAVPVLADANEVLGLRKAKADEARESTLIADTVSDSRRRRSNFYIGDWKGTKYVFAPDQGGDYQMIRKASVLDIDNLPPLP
jgi:hypothetical protein